MSIRTETCCSSSACTPCGSLGYDELVCDGMYDVWGEFPELTGAEGQGLPRLAELRSLPAWPGDPREV